MARASKYKSELKHMWTQAILEEPADKVLKRVVRELNQARHKDEIRMIIRGCVPLSVLLLRDAELLRCCLSADERVELYFRSSQTDYLMRETAPLVAKASRDRYHRFWREAVRYVKYQGFLWLYAPEDIKNAIYREQVKPIYANQGPSKNPKLTEVVLVIDWKTELETKQTHEVLNSALTVLDSLLQRGNQLKFARLLPEALLELPEAGHIRKLLPEAAKVALYSKFALTVPSTDFWLGELQEFLREVDHLTKRQFWQEVAEHIPADSRALTFAPDKIKQQVQISRFKAYFDTLAILKGLKPKVAAVFGSEQVYSSLDDNDVLLAKEWIQREETDDSYGMAKMLSARGAEKVAKLFYDSLGYLVIDIAITQLDVANEPRDWLRYDLSVEGHANIDVKNARLPVKSKIYKEHIVPRFKQDRDHQNVVIAGVQSPYLQLNHMQKPDEISFSVADITFLGETTLERLSSLECSFSGPLKLTLASRDNKGTFIPPWAFEYPERFYARTKGEKEIICNLSTMPVPPLNIVYEVDTQPIPIYLAFGTSVSPEWLSALPYQQVKLIKQLGREKHYIHSLPYIYLSVLSHFVERLQEVAKHDNDSLSYIFDTIFFGGKTEDKESSKYPLGIYDPLKTVYNLCLALEKVWERRHDSALQEMSVFQLTGRGLFRGRSTSHRSFTTLLAYCGGSIKKKGKCGYSPLIIGVHPVCSHCRKLICQECNFCEQDCQRLKVNVVQAASIPADV